MAGKSSSLIIFEAALASPMVSGGFALACRWLHCEVVFNVYSDFCQHLLEHLQVEWSSASDVICGVCGNPLGRDESAYRHIYFHAWLVYLSARGSFYQTSENLPPCKLPEDFSSIPDFPTPFCCAWKKCCFQTDDVASLYSHVSKHPQACVLGGDYDVKDQQHSCLWEGCSFTCSRLANLVAHLRSHTQEKVVACPQCGLLFTARTKLRDHLVRQHQTEDLTFSTATTAYQCAYCLRCFGNKSLLQAHANRHINKHICPLCNLTLHSKSAVKRHMLFRHTNKATVSCPHCSANLKDVHSLDSHVLRCHQRSSSFNSSSVVECKRSPGVESQRSTTIGPLAVAGSPNLGGHLFPLQTSTPTVTALVKTTVFRCSVEGCKFYSTTRPGLCVHMTRKHPPEEPQGNYACHLCPMRTTKGFLLSRHLISKHNHQRPSGHFRFNYVLCPEDGLYRLQTTRLDSVEVATALLGPQTVDQLLMVGASEQDSVNT